MRRLSLSGSAVFILLSLLFLCRPAAAYVGPGAGLSAIGAFLAVVAAVIVTLFGFIWYPIKRILRIKKKKESGGKESGTEEPGDADEHGKTE